LEQNNNALVQNSVRYSQKRSTIRTVVGWKLDTMNTVVYKSVNN
jgi:hypothetical protein